MPRKVYPTPGLKLLNDVFQLYQRQLVQDAPKGKLFLKKLGIHSPDTLEAFRIGWSDGKLWFKASEAQRHELQKLGLLTHNHKEIFADGLTFPCLDSESGDVVDLYCLKKYQNRKINLLKPRRGLIHPEPLHNAKELIVTDWLEAALSIHQSGWKAVVFVRGPEDITASLPRLQELKPVRIWVCSAQHSARLSASLKPVGSEILKLVLHRNYRRINAETLKRQMQDAGKLIVRRQKPDFIEATDTEAIYEKDGCRFTFSGLNAKLKLVLTLTKGTAVHTDRIDLLSASSRKRFSKNAATVAALSPEVIEATLIDCIAEIKELMEAQKRKPQDEMFGLTLGLSIIPLQRKNDAVQALKSANLTDIILSDLAAFGLVGERDNALLLYLVSISRKLQRPLSALLRSESGSGKSNLVERVIDLTPTEDVVYLSRLSANALYYMPPESLKHKLLVIEERDGSDLANYAVRILQSKGFLTTAIPLAPEESGAYRTKLIKVEGPVAYIETTTAKDIDAQNLNRCFEIQMDESSAQTAGIIKERQRRRALTQERTDCSGIMEKHHDMQRLLVPAPILIPYASQITFPCHQVRFRRDHERLLGLIDASALLHQHQRAWRTTPRGKKVLLANLKDYEIAHRLMLKALSFAVHELSTIAKTAWEYVQKLKGRKFTRRELMQALKWQYWKAYGALMELRQHELLGIESGSGTRPTLYFAHEVSLSNPDLGLLTTRELKTSC